MLSNWVIRKPGYNQYYIVQQQHSIPIHAAVTDVSQAVLGGGWMKQRRERGASKTGDNFSNKIRRQKEEEN